MRYGRITALFSLILLNLSVVQEAAQETKQTRDDNHRNIRLNITDKNRNVISTLRKEDIRVSDEGVIQDILSLQQQSDTPLAIGLLFDLSLSQERTLPIQKAAALAFTNSVMHPLKDTMAVISFTGKAKLEQDLTGELTQIRTAVQQLRPAQLPPGYSRINSIPPKPGSDLADIGSTALWDAIYFACGDVLVKSPNVQRRAIVLLTDGDDTSSLKQMKQAVEKAIFSDVVIYGVGIGDAERAGIDKRDLRAASEQTGGRAFFPKTQAELYSAFTQIEKELREHYLLAYIPKTQKADNSFRKVKIEITNPDLRRQGLRLSYCERYFMKGQ